MAIFEKVETPVKLWTTIDDVIGTAHIGRDGEWKDFRPARAVGSPEKHPGVIWHGLYWPAKGAGVESWQAEYRLAAVEYRQAQAPICTWRLSQVMCSPEMRAQVASLPPVEYVVVGADYEYPRFPAPDWKKAEIAAGWAAYEAECQARNLRLAAKELSRDEFVAWVEALPANSQERRWLRRFALLGKAGKETRDAISRAFPGKSWPGDDEIRRWLTGDSTSGAK